MAAVAAITSHEANKVGDELDRAVERYIPAYGALARADIRSLEQALALRRVVIGELTGMATDASRARLRSDYQAKGDEKAKEVATARQLIGAEIAEKSSFADVAALAQLDTRLEFLQQQRDPYDAQVA